MKITAKEKVKLSVDITTNADTIRILMMFYGLWVKHTMY